MTTTKNLASYFPMIRNRQEVLNDILSRDNLRIVFQNWDKEQQEAFLNILTGVRGIKMLYDSFFKEILDPDTTPERLEELLSLILKQKVRILKVLPNDTTRIASENTLLIMDIVVELEDGSIANVECQKSGYAFPGQRAACYSADLLMRQFKRIRGKKGKSFTYRDIKKVYTIIFYEISPTNFHAFPNNYIHRSRQESDTGIKIELLQEYIFIPLDIFFGIHQNKGIRNKLEAWLTFLGNDKPEVIMELLEKYPCFRAMYEDIYELCCNTEKVMGMFSKELQKLDENTMQYMIDEMQDTIDKKTKEIADKNKQIADKDKQIAEQTSIIHALKQQLMEQEQK